MSNVRAFPNRSLHADVDHEANDRAPEIPDIEKIQRLLGDMLESTATPLQKSSRERELRLRNFRSERLRLVDDLLVVIEERGDQYIATSYDTGQYGLGCSPESSIQDLCSVLEDYYDLLTEDKDQLSDALLGHLRYLDSILREAE